MSDDDAMILTSSSSRDFFAVGITRSSTRGTGRLTLLVVSDLLARHRINAHDCDIFSLLELIISQIRQTARSIFSPLLGL